MKNNLSLSRSFQFAMAAPLFEVDAIVAEQTEGTLPPEAPNALGSSLDSFQHVEAVMKEDDVSTLGLDSQDWEMVSEMVADTENAATDFMQGTHVVLEEPKVDLQSSSRQWRRLWPTLSWVRLPVASMPPPSPRVWRPLRLPVASMPPPSRG